MRLPPFSGKPWLVAAGLLFAALPALAQEPFAGVAQQVNKKVVKVYGSGGFRSLPAYGTGVLVSPDGYILTVANHLLDTPDLRVHLYDGRRFPAKVVVVEPELDAALIKIDKVEELPFFEVSTKTKFPKVQPGDWVLGFSNQFEIATRDEPLSVQRGVIAAYAKLHGRRGIFEAAYRGDVYVIDAITNNPGAAGGALTTRKGELIGIIGRELKNTLSDTWINYAVPVQVLAEFVEKKEKWKPLATTKKSSEGPAGYHGIVLVPDVVERTPPFVEEVLAGSPGAKAGLKPDDLIVYLDGEPVVSVKTFRELMKKARPGTVVRIEVRRGDKLTGIDLKLEEPPAKK